MSESSGESIRWNESDEIIAQYAEAAGRHGQDSPEAIAIARQHPELAVQFALMVVVKDPGREKI